MLRRQWILPALLAIAISPAIADDLIVPGIRVGPVTRMSTEQSLLRALGKAAVKEDVDVGEGMWEPGLVIYKNDPGRRLDVVWNEEKPQHPRIVFLCYDAEVGKPCRWRTSSGIGVGTTLKELERRNGKPFGMIGWGSDVGGNLVSFQDGRLERELPGLMLTLGPETNNKGEYVPNLSHEESNAVLGEIILPSSHPVLQKLNPRVRFMSLEFPPDPVRNQR